MEKKSIPVSFIRASFIDTLFHGGDKSMVCSPNVSFDEPKTSMAIVDIICSTMVITSS